MLSRWPTCASWRRPIRGSRERDGCLSVGGRLALPPRVMIGYFPDQSLFVFAHRKRGSRTQPFASETHSAGDRACAQPLASAACGRASEPYTPRIPTIHSAQRSVWQEWLLVSRSFVRGLRPCSKRPPSRQLRLRNSKKLHVEPTSDSR